MNNAHRNELQGLSNEVLIARKKKLKDIWIKAKLKPNSMQYRNAYGSARAFSEAKLHKIAYYELAEFVRAKYGKTVHLTAKAHPITLDLDGFEALMNMNSIINEAIADQAFYLKAKRDRTLTKLPAKLSKYLITKE